MKNWSDQKFNKFLENYPSKRGVGFHAQIAHYCWTNAKYIKVAANFLASVPNANILDIGSGVGKFCIIGNSYYPHAKFTGIEKDEESYKISIDINNKVSSNANFIHGDFVDTDISLYTGLYLFNPFIMGNSYGDSSIYDKEFFRKASMMSSGTRLVTFAYGINKVPNDYILQTEIDSVRLYVKK